MNFITNNKPLITNPNTNKKTKINQSYFTLRYVPYNKILNNLLIYLQMKLSPLLFKEIYKFFIGEIKKYLKKNIWKNHITNNTSVDKNRINSINNIDSNNRNKDIRIISDFCCGSEFNKNNTLFNLRNKANLKKYLPWINLSYSKKLRNEFLKQKEITSFSNVVNSNKNRSNNISLLEEKELSYIFTDNNNTASNTIKRINKIKTTNKNRITNHKQNKNKSDKIFLANNYNFNTINTTLYEKSKNKLNSVNKTKKMNKKMMKTDNQRFSGNMSNRIFNRTSKIASKNSNKNKKEDSNLKNIKNINRAVVINNTFFNKYKNNYNFGLIPSQPKNIKILNIKLKDKEKNKSLKFIKPIQNPEEMLDKIKNTLDDDNLKVMLNFSYENFLSKESERESKELSIEDGNI